MTNDEPPICGVSRKMERRITGVYYLTLVGIIAAVVIIARMARG